MVNRHPHQQRTYSVQRRGFCRRANQQVLDQRVPELAPPSEQNDPHAKKVAQKQVRDRVLILPKEVSRRINGQTGGRALMRQEKQAVLNPHEQTEQRVKRLHQAGLDGLTTRSVRGGRSGAQAEDRFPHAEQRRKLNRR